MFDLDVLYGMLGYNRIDTVTFINKEGQEIEMSVQDFKDRKPEWVDLTGFYEVRVTIKNFEAIDIIDG